MGGGDGTAIPKPGKNGKVSQVTGRVKLSIAKPPKTNPWAARRSKLSAANSKPRYVPPSLRKETAPNNAIPTTQRLTQQLRPPQQQRQQAQKVIPPQQFVSRPQRPSVPQPMPQPVQRPSLVRTVRPQQQPRSMHQRSQRPQQLRPQPQMVLQQETQNQVGRVGQRVQNLQTPVRAYRPQQRNAMQQQIPQQPVRNVNQPQHAQQLPALQSRPQQRQLQMAAQSNRETSSQSEVGRVGQRVRYLQPHTLPQQRYPAMQRRPQPVQR